MTDMHNNEMRQRILDAADDLFSKRGYAAVTLRDIAGVVGIKHASLYYYAPGGKEDLFVEVMERSLRRHHDGMVAAIAGAGDDFRAQMYAVADWFMAQPPLDLLRMTQADMPAVEDKAKAERLMWLAYESLRKPIATAVVRAAGAGELDVLDPDQAALSFVALMQNIHNIPPWFSLADRRLVAHQTVDMLLKGWLKR